MMTPHKLFSIRDSYYFVNIDISEELEKIRFLSVKIFFLTKGWSMLEVCSYHMDRVFHSLD